MAELHVAVDFGGTHIRFATLDPELRDIQVVASRADLPREALRTHFLDALDHYLVETGGRARLVSINVAIAGQIDPQAGTVFASPNLPSLTGAPLQAWLVERFGVKVAIDNDVRAAALGEWRSAALSGVRHLVCVYWGTGIGGGIVCDGRLLRGAHNAGGEIGHTVFVPEGLPCHCGKRGCFEAYAGGWAIPRLAELAPPADGEPALALGVTTAEIFALADRGHLQARRARNDAARALGILAANLVVTFNPEAVVLGGGLTRHYPLVGDWVRRAIDENALAADKPGLRVHLSTLGDEAALRGAVHLAENR